MPDKYTDLPREGRAEALVRAADASGREGCFLEKDIWGVWSLAALCGCDEIGGARKRCALIQADWIRTASAPSKDSGGGLIAEMHVL